MAHRLGVDLGVTNIQVTHLMSLNNPLSVKKWWLTNFDAKLLKFPVRNCRCRKTESSFSSDHSLDLKDWDTKFLWRFHHILKFVLKMVLLEEGLNIGLTGETPTPFYHPDNDGLFISLFLTSYHIWLMFSIFSLLTFFCWHFFKCRKISAKKNPTSTELLKPEKFGRF